MNSGVCFVETAAVLIICMKTFTFAGARARAVSSSPHAWSQVAWERVAANIVRTIACKTQVMHITIINVQEKEEGRSGLRSSLLMLMLMKL